MYKIYKYNRRRRVTTKRIVAILLASAFLSIAIASLASNTASTSTSHHALASTSGDWSKDIRITNNNRWAEHPSAVLDVEGNVHVVWADSKTGNFEIFYKKTDVSGRTLLEGQVSDTPSKSYFPSIAIDSYDNVHIVWMDNQDGNWEVYYKELDSSGAPSSNTLKLTDTPIISAVYRPHILSESPAELITDPNGISSLKPDLAIDTADNVHIVWSDQSKGNFEVFYIMLDRHNNRVVDTLRITHSQADSTNPCVEVDASGNAYIFWCESDLSARIMYTYLELGGRKGTPDQVVLEDPNGGVKELSTKMGGNGCVDIVWSSGGKGLIGPQNTEIYYMRFDPAAPESVQPVRVSYSHFWSENPDMVVNRDGSIGLVWQDIDNNRLNTELYYVRITEDGEQLGREHRLTVAPGISTTPSIAVHEDVTVIVWSDNREGHMELYMKVHSPIEDVLVQEEIGFGAGPSFTAVALSSFSILSLIGYLGGTEAGRVSLLFPIFPLYSRLSKDKLLDNKIRDDIFHFIEDNPGVNYSTIRESLDLKNGSLSYHLNTLERESLIKSRRDGSFRRYYPMDVTVLPNEIHIEIIRAINRYPGVSQSEIARLLGTSRQVVNYHVGLLFDSGKIHMRKEGRRTALYLRNTEICA